MAVRLFPFQTCFGIKGKWARRIGQETWDGARAYRPNFSVPGGNLFMIGKSPQTICHIILFSWMFLTLRLKNFQSLTRCEASFSQAPGGFRDQGLDGTKELLGDSTWATIPTPGPCFGMTRVQSLVDREHLRSCIDLFRFSSTHAKVFHIGNSHSVCPFT